MLLKSNDLERNKKHNFINKIRTCLLVEIYENLKYHELNSITKINNKTIKEKREEYSSIFIDLGGEYFNFDSFTNKECSSLNNYQNAHNTLNGIFSNNQMSIILNKNIRLSSSFLFQREKKKNSFLSNNYSCAEKKKHIDTKRKFKEFSIIEAENKSKSFSKSVIGNNLTDISNNSNNTLQEDTILASYPNFQENKNFKDSYFKKEKNKISTKNKHNLLENLNLENGNKVKNNLKKIINLTKNKKVYKNEINISKNLNGKNNIEEDNYFNNTSFEQLSTEACEYIRNSSIKNKSVNISYSISPKKKVFLMKNNLNMNNSSAFNNLTLESFSVENPEIITKRNISFQYLNILCYKLKKNFDIGNVDILN